MARKHQLTDEQKIRRAREMVIRFNSMGADKQIIPRIDYAIGCVNIALQLLREVRDGVAGQDPQR